MKATVATALALSLTFGASATAGPAQRASLGLAGKRPLVIKGTHFKPDEHVALRGLAPARAGGRVVANRRGSFLIRFRLTVGRCDRVSAHALGSRGSRAHLLLLRPQIDCIPDGRDI
jgi:hypothetical protein